jgi:hypothetical protein
MPSLSPDLKSLVYAVQSHPGPVRASPDIQDFFEDIECEARSRKLGWSTWISVLTATTMTINSPETMVALFQYVTKSKPPSEGAAIAEFMREIGLLCIGINGVRAQLNLRSQ